ncbi:MAG: hypothetical protein ISR85_03765 [Kiritimatiellales bacterium]|nr:hypothetical protein [Kiritimatiellota bacterium]MBL7012029.1 hypothetical protein [Kiritimatiellales bacterium]
MKRKLFAGFFATGVVLLVLAVVAIESVSAAETITDFQIVQDSTNFSVNLPDEFVGASLSLMRCSNLFDAAWSSVLQTNATTNGVLPLGSVVLPDLVGGGSLITNSSVAVFYKVTANSTVDSDSDGLNNIYGRRVSP